MKRKSLILISLLLAAFVINLDTTIVNVALPTLVRELHASNSQLQWVVDAFNLLFAGSVLAAGSLSDRFGRKGMLLAGLSVFGVASLAGGLTDSAGPLIAARAVMGIGAAMVFPSTLSLITNVFTERRERALAIGLWGAITGAAIALGPIVGGWLLEVSRLAQHLLRDDAGRGDRGRARRRLRPDLAGPARASHRPRRVRPLDRDGRVARVHDHRGPEHGWASARTLGGFALTAALAAAFVGLGAAGRAADARPQPVPQPAVHGRERLGRDLVLRAVRVHLPRHPVLPVPEGLGPLSTGVRLLPVASCVAISSIVGARLAVRLGTKLVVASGLLAMAAFYVWVATASATTGYGTIAAQMVVLGTGMGLRARPRPRRSWAWSEGEGRRRIGGQRRDPTAGRHARCRGHRQRLRVPLRRQATSALPAGLPARVADRPRIRRRRAHLASKLGPPAIPCWHRRSTTPPAQPSSTASTRPTGSPPASPPRAQ